MKKNVFTPQVIATTALLIALNIVFTRFLYLMLLGGALRLSLGVVPLMLTGVLFGPVVGAAAGIATDIIGVLVNPQGSVFLGYTLTSALTGALPGLVFYNNTAKTYPLNKIILAEILVSFIPLLLLNTIWAMMLQGKALSVLLPFRVLARAVLAPIEVFLVASVCKLYKNINNKG